VGVSSDVVVVETDPRVGGIGVSHSFSRRPPSVRTIGRLNTSVGGNAGGGCSE
jgi:hypothetical protein